MRSAPWHVKGINPQARETAREAARRSGMSVGQWLNTVILDQADRDDDDDALFDSVANDRGDDLASINARLDELGRQIERLVGHRAGGRTADDPSRIADAIARLNGRIDDALSEDHGGSGAREQRANSVDQALARLGRERVRAAASYAEAEPVEISVEQAMAEIAARQRALDAELAAPVAAASRCRADEAVESLRKDLAEIGRAVSDAMPRGAVEALEGEVRALGGRIDAGRAGDAEGPALAGLEQGLREVRDALRGLAPAEGLVGVDAAVRTLSGKLDMVAAGRQDPATLRQVENAIAGLRNDVGRIASGDALAALTQEVRGLADKIERGAPPVSGAEIFTAIDRRIGSIADAIESVRTQSGRSTSPDLDHLVKSLGDKLERIQSVPNDALSRGEQLALGGLEDRITTLVEKLDASEGRLGHLAAIERGMGELLIHLEGLRANPAATAARPDAAPAAPGEALNHDIASLRQAHAVGEERTQETLEAVHDTIETVVDRLAKIETGIRRERREDTPLPAGPEPLAVRSFAAEASLLHSPPPAAAAAQPLSPPPELSPAHTTAFVPEPEPASEFVPGPQPGPQLAPMWAPMPDPMPEPMPDPMSESMPEPTPEPTSGPTSIPTATPASAATASRRRAVSPAPRAATRQKPAATALPPVDPNLPPDHPLEPGSGPPRVRAPTAGIAGATAAERVAASEGPLRAARSLAGTAADADPKSGYLQAARRAAQYAAQGEKRSEAAPAADPATLAGKLSHHLKGLFVGLSIVVLLVTALRYAVDYLETADLALPSIPMLAEQTAPVVAVRPREATPRLDVPAVIVPPTGPKIISVDSIVPGPATDPAPFIAVPAAPTLGALSADQGLLATASPRPPASPPPTSPPASVETQSEVTGALASRPAARAAPATMPATGAADAERLPAGIGGKMLIAAATAGEPGAAYEIATRFAEGRGVPQSFAEAAIWYERAAKGGLAPALFRLGALYEKGSGVAKDLNEARRLYLAAAQKGNANAMHNIGVLYAEGIDGKPDFKTAAQWFRKSSTFGIADSQYNLAVLCARGIGVERNLSEAYQWFALAAKGGDADAGKKRDEIAAGLDQRTLAALRHAVDTWVPDQAPEDASTVAAPAGGWDQAESAKSKSRPRAQSRPAAQPI